MESSSFNYVVRGFAYDESFSTADASGKDQIGSMNWQAKAPFLYTNNLGLFPNDAIIENQVFGETGLPPLMRNYSSNPIMAAFQNYKLESSSTESGLFDRKLGMFVDQREAQIFDSRSEVSMPSKRPRVGGSGSSTPCCQVHGCNKSLSSCKEYHKRHSVCEVHSKTAKVIVNGVEQRFCQQCSRFHLLGEFDDGKRSCRKRLAGHNERRRKPHAGVLSRQHGRLLPSYDISIKGNEFGGSTGVISSFPLTDTLRSPYQHKYEPNGMLELNLEEGTAHDLQSISSITDEQLHSESLSPRNFEKNGRFDFINRYVGPSSSASTVQGPSRSASASESARSFLSSRSCTPCHSSGTRMSNSQSHPFVFPGSNYEPTQDSGMSHDMNPMLGASEGSLVVFGVDRMFQGSSEDSAFADEECSIDLLQLSSQIERVEHEKRSSQVNLVNGGFVGLTSIT